jgi:hypothetical protein
MFSNYSLDIVVISAKMPVLPVKNGEKCEKYAFSEMAIFLTNDRKSAVFVSFCILNRGVKNGVLLNNLLGLFVL